MVQGLGLAESTPGPLIMVTQFIGFLAAWKFAGEFNPLFYGTLGALITTYMTFLPCFFFIFLGAPYIEMLSGNRRIQAALVGVASAVVGVIVNLGVFFGQKVLLPSSRRVRLFCGRSGLRFFCPCAEIPYSHALPRTRGSIGRNGLASIRLWSILIDIGRRGAPYVERNLQSRLALFHVFPPGDSFQCPVW